MLKVLEFTGSVPGSQILPASPAILLRLPVFVEISGMSAKDFVSDLFERREEGDSTGFFNALAADVVWTAKGTTPISGTYHGKDDYLQNVYKPLLSIFAGPTVCRVQKILGDGDTVAVEWHGETPTSSGSIYSQDYCRLIRVTEDGRAIREVTGYFDTALVNALLAAPAGI